MWVDGRRCANPAAGRIHRGSREFERRDNREIYPGNVACQARPSLPCGALIKTPKDSTLVVRSKPHGTLTTRICLGIRPCTPLHAVPDPLMDLNPCPADKRNRLPLPHLGITLRSYRRILCSDRASYYIRLVLSRIALSASRSSPKGLVAGIATRRKHL